MEEWEKHLSAALDAHFAIERDFMASDIRDWLSACESPIELILGSRLALVRLWGDRPRCVFHTHETNWADFERNESADIFWLFRQAPIGPYRADFLIIASIFVHREDAAPVHEVHKFVIECDGHEFHERTKEQAKKDRRRDREMLAKGYRVLRFTGSEIYADAAKCVKEVKDLLENIAIGYSN